MVFNPQYCVQVMFALSEILLDHDKISIALRILDMHSAKTHENQTPLHVCLNNSVAIPSFKIGILGHLVKKCPLDFRKMV